MTNTPAGWYPDPEDAAQSRWWDGTRWTDNRAALQPTIAPPYSAEVGDLTAPAGTSWNTIWIWILVFLPYVSSLGFFTIDWSRAFDVSHPMKAELSMIASPGYLFTIFAGWISFGLFVWFSYLDWKELKNRGVQRPFHWAWGFLTIVYTIGRSVVVRRRTGHGISPMWVTIILYVVFVIAMLVFIGLAMSTIFASIPNTPGY